MKTLTFLEILQEANRSGDLKIIRKRDGTPRMVLLKDFKNFYEKIIKLNPDGFEYFISDGDDTGERIEKPITLEKILYLYRKRIGPI